MRQSLKFIIAFAIAAVVLLLFRALVFTLCVVDGNALNPELQQGDRVLVNRWSYGLRTGSECGLFRYGRILKSEVRPGDIIAVENPTDSVEGVFIFRCKNTPGDTISYKGNMIIVPGLFNCAKEDYYWLETVDNKQFGLIGESRIIGRVCMVVFNHDDSQPFYTGYDKDRLFVLK